MIAEKPQIAQVLQTIRGLSPQEQLDLLGQIALLLRGSLAPQPTRSIMELEGLGATIWRGIHAQDYVNRERAGWDG